MFFLFVSICGDQVLLKVKFIPANTDSRKVSANKNSRNSEQAFVCFLMNLVLLLLGNPLFDWIILLL